MHPAFSVVFLTTLIGAGQGLFLALFAMERLARYGFVQDTPPPGFLGAGAVVAAALTAGGLVASTFHLGRPERAWRAASKWRTSWLSREVIALPLFLGLLALYAAAQFLAWPGSAAIGAAAALACVALFVCTGMVYAGIRFLQEWASPWTLVNFVLLGTASGTTLAAALAWLEWPSVAADYAAAALMVTMLALVTRAASLARNARLRPKSTLQSAIGVKHPRIEQKAQGFMGGSFNTREFFHGASPSKLRAIKRGFLAFAFAVPMLLLGAGLGANAPVLFAVAFGVQYAGLLAERWFFLAQANHPQNLYYQAIS
ncbi:MAG TPA: DmsC/YnfH family molybdoenzyme membrane anchor subunit [Casimicrobiaceae bacterium]|nr:DmsC/YnfH family molybdoenzyme membrane anchor subunit [Casimicrobiaceae bacterium]